MRVLPAQEIYWSTLLLCLKVNAKAQKTVQNMSTLQDSLLAGFCAQRCNNADLLSGRAEMLAQSVLLPLLGLKWYHVTLVASLRYSEAAPNAVANSRQQSQKV